MKIWRMFNLLAVGAIFVLYVIAMRSEFFGLPSHTVFMLVISGLAIFSVSNIWWRVTLNKSIRASKKTEVELHGR